MEVPDGESEVPQPARPVPPRRRISRWGARVRAHGRHRSPNIIMVVAEARRPGLRDCQRGRIRSKRLPPRSGGPATRQAAGRPQPAYKQGQWELHAATPAAATPRWRGMTRHGCALPSGTRAPNHTPTGEAASAFAPSPARGNLRVGPVTRVCVAALAATSRPERPARHDASEVGRKVLYSPTRRACQRPVPPGSYISMDSSANATAGQHGGSGRHRTVSCSYRPRR